METITEDYVSFETAKLLREKGFDWTESPFYSEQDRDEWWQNNSYTVPNEEYNPELPFDSETLTLVAPHVSLQMAMKWLREAHNILLVVDYIYECTNTSYVYKIYRLGQNGIPEREPIIGMSLKDNKEHVVGYHDYKLSYKDYATYEEAAEEGIKYCLENLI